MSQAEAPLEVNLGARVEGSIGETGAQYDTFFFPFVRSQITGDTHDPPQPAQNEGEHERESNFIDGSDHFFTMYTKITGEEDKKMVDRWQAEADGILIFVSLSLLFSHIVRTRSLVIDRSIFCRRRRISRNINPRPPTQPTRHSGILSREYIPAACCR